MAGAASAHDSLAASVGAGIEAEAKATSPSYDALEQIGEREQSGRPTLLGRLKAALAA